MAYIGTNAPTGFSTSAKDTFSGDNSTVAFTMSRGQSTGNDVQVFVDNVRQEPIIAYNVSGATLTFTEAPPTGTNNIYCVHNSTQATSVLPPTDLGSRDYVFGDDVSLKSDSAVLNFGLDSEVNITHVHNTGLLLNGTNQLQFGDSGTFIHQSADGVLDLVSDTELELNATTIDINGAVDISGDITLGGEIVSAATISVTGGSALTLKSTDAGATAAPVLRLTRDSASPADNDLLGQVIFNGDNDAGENVEYATINMKALDVSDSSEDGEFDISTMVAGTSRSRMRIDSSEVIFNENSVDVDFRVESDSVSSMLFVNAGDNAVCIGKNTTALGTAGSAFLQNYAHITADNDSPLTLNRLSTDGILLDLRKNGSSVGTISTNGNSLPSDKNFKRDIKDLNIGLDLVSQLQPKSFNTIVDDENSPVMYGLIAQDLEVALEKVGVTKNSAWILQHEEKNDAKESDYKLNYTKLIPILINAVQELEARIKTLEGA